MSSLFVRRQVRRPDPLIDVRLFRRRALSASIGSNVTLVLASAGTGMLAVQYLQLVLDYRPFVAALWMLPLVGLLMLGVAVATTLVRWVRPGHVVGAGLGIGAVGASCGVTRALSRSSATAGLSANPAPPGRRPRCRLSRGRAGA